MSNERQKPTNKKFRDNYDAVFKKRREFDGLEGKQPTEEDIRKGEAARDRLDDIMGCRC